MRCGVVRQAIRPDHRVLEGEDALHVGFAHREINGARRQELVDAELEVAPDLLEVHAGDFGMGPRPGDESLGRHRGAARRENGRGGAVRIAVERDRLAFHARLDEGQRLLRAPVVRATGDLVMRDHHRHAELAADAEGFLERGEHVVALVAHVRHVEAVALGERPAHLDHLLGRRRVRRLVVEAGRHA